MNLSKNIIAGSRYGFSATRIEDLGASEYTLVTIAADASGSVESFRAEIERCIQEVVRACRRSPRADNLMLRVLSFDDELHEVHGFKPLSECHLAGYEGCIHCAGATALHEAAFNVVGAMHAYGSQLASHDFHVNGILFVITDGADNASRVTAADVAGALRKATTDEALESLTSVLVGVNVTDPNVASYLSELRRTAGFGQYVELGAADATTLARLASFASRFISAQSLALGSGGPSTPLTF